MWAQKGKQLGVDARLDEAMQPKLSAAERFAMLRGGQRHLATDKRIQEDAQQFVLKQRQPHNAGGPSGQAAAGQVTF